RCGGGGVGTDTGSGAGGQGAAACAVWAGGGEDGAEWNGVGQGCFATGFCEFADEYAADTGLLRTVVVCGAAAGAGGAAAGVERAGWLERRRVDSRYKF